MDKALLGIFVEDMETVVLDGNLNAVACASGRAVGNAGNKVDVAAVYILKNFSISSVTSMSANDRTGKVVIEAASSWTFGTHTNNNVLADIIPTVGSEAGAILSKRKPDC